MRQYLLILPATEASLLPPACLLVLLRATVIQLCTVPFELASVIPKAGVQLLSGVQPCSPGHN